jgi:hypothetical protein
MFIAAPDFFEENIKKPDYVIYFDIFQSFVCITFKLIHVSATAPSG